MRLMFSNCLRYNTSDSPIIEQVRKLRVCCIFAKLRLTLDCTLLLYSSGRVHTVISEATLTHFPFLHSPMTVLQRRHAMRRLSLLILCFSFPSVLSSVYRRHSSIATLAFQMNGIHRSWSFRQDTIIPPITTTVECNQ